MLNAEISRVIDKLQENIIIFLPLMLSVGILIYFALPFEPSWYSGLIVFALLLNAWHMLRRYEFALRPILLAFLAIGAVASLGFMAAQVRSAIVAAPVLAEELRFVHINGIVERIDRLDGRKGSRVLISDVTLDGIAPDKTPKKVRIRIIKDDNLQAGQRISVKGNLLPPPPPVMPQSFNFQRWAYYNQIGAVGYAFYEPKDVFEADFVSIHYIERLRKAIEQHIYTLFGAENQTKAEIVTALITGRKTQMRESDKVALQDAGLAHMLAISGLHIGLIVSAVFFFVRLVLSAVPYFALNWPTKKIAAVIAFIMALLYVLLSGASLPAVRAIIMMGIAMLAIVMDRNPFSLRLVAFAALVILLILPESLLSVSFQLSFSAVAALIIFYERTRKWWQAQYARPGFFWRCMLYGLGVVATTLVSTVATAAPGLYHFNHFAVYGAFSNLFAVPILAMFVMPCCLLAILLWPFGLGQWAFWVAGYGAQIILNIAHYCADLPYAVLHQPFIGAWGVLIWTVLGCIIWQWHKKLLPLFAVLLVVGGALLFVEKQYNIIITSDYRLITFQDNMGRLTAYGDSPRRFDKDYIAEYYGRTSKDYLRWSKSNDCDPDGCFIAVQDNVFVEIIRFPAAYVDACRRAALVILDFPMDALTEEQRERGCRVPVVSRFDTWRYGSYGIYVSPKGFIHMDTLYSRDNYDRPWSVPSWR